MLDLCRPLAGSGWREELKEMGEAEVPKMMGYPAACLLTPLPATVMSVPSISESPLREQGCAEGQHKHTGDTPHAMRRQTCTDVDMHRP